MTTKYVFVKSTEKQPVSFLRVRQKIFKALFGNPFRFVWNMVAYHGLILLVHFGLGFNVPAKVALPLGLTPVEGVQFGTVSFIATLSWTSALFFAIILLCDFWLLLIIKGELKPKVTDLDRFGVRKKEWLTYKKIVVIECIFFVAGILNPYIRAGLLFFGANTIQIAIVKLWMIKQWRPKKLQFGIAAQYFFILGSYLLILDLLRRTLIWMVWK